MQGSINFDGSLIGNITGGGGGGGSEVVITPVLTSGTKIATINVNGVDYDIYSTDYSGDISTLQSGLSTANNNITALQGRVTTAEENITTLQSDMTAAEGDISTLQSGLSTANSNITALQGRVTTAEENITTLQSDMTAAESIIGDGQLDIGNDLTDAVNEINQSLSQLENNKLFRTTVTLSSDGNGYAKTDFSTDDYQLVSASGQGFSCFPTDGADGWWYIVFINIASWTKYPNLANKAITITYQEK